MTADPLVAARVYGHAYLACLRVRGLFVRSGTVR